MAEHAIKFTSEMISAILGHEKTQTRRPVKQDALQGMEIGVQLGECFELNDPRSRDCTYIASFCPYGTIGDILWIESTDVWLEVTAIRMERLHDITEDDAEAEGMLECVGMFSEREYIQIAEQIGSEINDLKPFFVQLWQSIYGPDSWSLNPWVWVIEFKVAQVGEE